MVLYFIQESAVGFSLFELKGIDETNVKLVQLQKQIADFSTFSQILKLRVRLYINSHLFFSPQPLKKKNNIYKS